MSLPFMASVSVSDKSLLQCKKCGDSHDKPINNKCDRVKQKEEKRDTSRENSARKTPKSTNEISQGDRVLDLVMNTMSSFTDKLSAMEEKISSLSSRMDNMPTATPARKSRSREKSKRAQILDSTDERDLADLVNVKDGTITTTDTGSTSLFSQTFPDTVVTFKATPTPARAKKAKPDFDLGVQPLGSTVQKTLDYQWATQFSKLPRVTSTLSRPTTTATTTWDVGDMTTGAGLQVDINNKTVRDLNHNLPVHMDQFGNIVQVQAVVNPTSGAQDMIQHTAEPLFTQQQQEVPQTASMDLLKANPLIQRLVEERVSMLEARMKTELSQGNPNNRKKSGRYNTSDTPCALPYRHWPNESCPSGATRKQTAFDDLSLGQFVMGFVSNMPI